jgi:hypothetical protein
VFLKTAGESGKQNASTVNTTITSGMPASKFYKNIVVILYAQKLITGLIIQYISLSIIRDLPLNITSLLGMESSTLFRFGTNVPAISPCYYLYWG